MEAILMKKNHIVSGIWIDFMILSAPFCSYHFVRDILSATILS